MKRNAYVWSNPKASDTALIANALLRPSLPDLTNLAADHGISRLRAVHEALKAEGTLRPGSGADRTVSRLLNNIERGLQEYQEETGHGPQ